MNDLFSEFDAVNFSDWLQKIETDLKGKPLDVLKSKPEPDLEINAYHHSESSTKVSENAYLRNVKRASNDWQIRQAFQGIAENNAVILNVLNEGVTAVGLEIDESTNYSELVKGIGFEHITSDASFSDKETAVNFQPNKNTHLNFDVLAMNLAYGKEVYTLEDFQDFYEAHKENKSVWVSGAIYGAAGASTVQELGITLAHLNEYIQFLSDQGKSLEEINDKIIIELSVNENYFVNIAKFRVIRSLVALLFKGHNTDYASKPPLIYGLTNLRHLAKNDANNNALRETTQAMSAVIGGCDVLTVDHSEFGSEKENKRFERISRNIQLILKEESYLGKVTDPAGGSYYLEELSNQLLNKAWELFLEIENKGGLTQAIKEDFIQLKIKENCEALVADMLDNSRTFLGVNKHPNSMEDWKEPRNNQAHQGIDFMALSPFFLENHFSKTAANHE